MTAKNNRWRLTNSTTNWYEIIYFDFISFWFSWYSSDHVRRMFITTRRSQISLSSTIAYAHNRMFANSNEFNTALRNFKIWSFRSYRCNAISLPIFSEICPRLQLCLDLNKSKTVVIYPSILIFDKVCILQVDTILLRDRKHLSAPSSKLICTTIPERSPWTKTYKLWNYEAIVKNRVNIAKKETVKRRNLKFAKWVYLPLMKKDRSSSRRKKINPSSKTSQDCGSNA